jgi:hypothetical protein
MSREPVRAAARLATSDAMSADQLRESMMTQYSLRPLADDELEVVAGGMSSTFQYGDFKMVVSATTDAVRVDYSDGTTCGWKETSKGKF